MTANVKLIRRRVTAVDRFRVQLSGERRFEGDAVIGEQARRRHKARAESQDEFSPSHGISIYTNVTCPPKLSNAGSGTSDGVHAYQYDAQEGLRRLITDRRRVMFLTPWPLLCLTGERQQVPRTPALGVCGLAGIARERPRPSQAEFRAARSFSPLPGRAASCARIGDHGTPSEHRACVRVGAWRPIHEDSGKVSQGWRFFGDRPPHVDSCNQARVVKPISSGGC